jgi:hypothetical protein
MGTPIVSYHVEGLHTGMARQRAAGTACTGVSRALRKHGVEAAIFGSVPAAAGFHASAAHVLSRQAAEANAESARRTDLAGRAGRAAGLGAELTASTTSIAAGGTPRPPDARGA